MGLLGLLLNKNKKKKKFTKEVEEPYIANVRFYADKDGNTFGAFVITEDVLTSIPVNPRDTFKLNNEVVDEWKLLLFSITKDSSLGDIEYYEGLNRLQKYIVGTKDDSVIVKPLTLEEQEDI